MALSNEERFSNVDPNELSPELQQVYKMLQRDYTQKRQADAKAAKEAMEKLEQVSKAHAELSTQFQAVRTYAQQVEDNNLKWQDWYKNLEESGVLTQQQQAAQAARASNDGTGQPATAGHMSATDRELLNTNREDLSPAQLEHLDKYFLGKYGNTLQGLTDNVTKLQKQLGYTLQLNDLVRNKGKDFDIDPKRIIDAAVSIGTDNLNVAFEKAYDKELKDREFAERLKAAKEEWMNEQKSSQLEGVTKSRTELFYTKPESLPNNYDQASQQILDELITNPNAANAAN